MIVPDYREFKHSAKGSTWREHKYIRKENGKYIYPEDSGETSKEKIIENLLNRILKEGWDAGSIEIIRSGDLTKEELNDLWEFVNDTNLEDDKNLLKTLEEFHKEMNLSNAEQKKLNNEITATKTKIKERKENLKKGLTEEELDEMQEFSNIIKKKADDEWLKTLVDFGKENNLTKDEQRILDYQISDVRKQVKDIYHNNMSCRNIYYLSHGGPGSGRYPLGSGDRPYQKFEGAGQYGGGIRGYIRSRREKKREEKEIIRRNKELKERLEKDINENKYEAEKQRVLREGTAREVMRYQGDLTNQELQSAYNRLDLETKIRNISQKELESGMYKIDRIMNTLKTGTDWAKISIDSYNTIADVYNSTASGQKNPLTRIKRF